MAALNWLEDTRRELAATGLSPAYQKRLLKELADHIDDVRCAERNHAMSIEIADHSRLSSRLGSPQDVAAVAKQQISHSFFAQRHPIITFLVFPLPLLAILLVGYTLGLIGLLSGFKSYSDVAWVASIAGVLINGLAYVPAILLTLVIAWIAIRSKTRLTWWLGAAMLIAVVSGLLGVTYRMPTTPGTGVLQVGFGFPPQLAQLPQTVIPLVITSLLIGCVLLKGQKTRETTPV